MNRLYSNIVSIWYIFLTNFPTLAGFAALSRVIEEYWAWEAKMVISVLAIVFIDTTLGVVLAIKNKVFRSKDFGRIAEKLIVYLSLLALGFIMRETLVWEYLELERDIAIHFIYTTIMLKEATSVIENANKLGHFSFSEQISKKFNKLIDLIKNKDNNNEKN